MTTLPRTIAIGLILAAFAGCEPGAPNVTPGPETPHGGTLFPLPDGQGYVEVRKETTAAIAGQKPQSRIVAYFLDSDKKTLAATPTGVSLKRPAGDPSVEFKPTSDPDPTKAGGLLSSFLPDRDDLGGDLSATIDGKQVTVTIALR